MATVRVCDCCTNTEDEFIIRDVSFATDEPKDGDFTKVKYRHSDYCEECLEKLISNGFLKAVTYTTFFQDKSPEINVELYKVRKIEHAHGKYNPLSFRYDCVDIYGREWPYPLAELCHICWQPDSCNDCNHTKLTDEDVKLILEGPKVSS